MNPYFRRPNEEMNRRFVRVEMHVREEVGKISHYNLPPPRVLAYPNMQPQYGLRFINKVKDPTFTTKLVRDNNGDPIRIEIYDSYTRSIVSPDCFISSTKVRITVLDAEFWKHKGGVNWSRSEFNQSVLSERDGKGPILIGPSLTIRLENGVGTFGNIIFNDNSSWTKSGFRLGVMVDVEGEEGYLNGKRVQEGVSESFRVMDRRVKASQKPDLLKLTHNVRCIKKIGKDRASLLQKKNINTVEDFLKFYYNDEAALREILFIKSESDKGWMSMVEHAKECADEFHTKCNASNNSSHGVGNILNRNSVHRTNGVDAESSPNYNTQVPSGAGSYGYGHGWFPRSFPRRDTDAWRDRPRGPPPSSCQDRSIMVPFYYDSS